MTSALLGMNEVTIDLLIITVKCAIVFGVLLSMAALMTLAERKVSAWIQYRYGPNRVGPFGLLQPLADLIKFVFKEEVTPAGANRFLFRLSPLLAAIPAMSVICFVPFGYEVTVLGRTVPMVIAAIPVGMLFFLAIGSLGVYGIIIGGWASNSKYSLLGGLRSSAQMISYELSLMLSLLSVIVLAGTVDLQEIIRQQDAMWNVVYAPIAFVIFVVTMFAETNRHPFDFAECEPELVGGFHTEYSSMKFALFFLGEYCAIIAISGMCTTLFLGGPDVPFLAWQDTPWWAGVIAFLAKTALFLFLFIWVRWSLPRFRYDQLMGLGWKVFLPVALLNLLVTGLVIALRGA